MGEQKIFKRYEVKFQIASTQQEKLLAVMREHMTPDEHGRSTVQSLYYDTPEHLLIRRSMEKPVYKEKLRLRSYGLAGPEDKVFLELKKKYQHVVYKRRISLTEAQASAVMDSELRSKATGNAAIRNAAEGNAPGGGDIADVLGEGAAPAGLGTLPGMKGRDAQILREIAFTAGRYPGLAPSCLISCHRQAWYGKEDRNLRITFDSNILWRDTDLNLHTGIYGSPILEDDQVIMEVKICGGIPLWLLQVLSAEHIYKTSFSKYGRAYTAMRECIPGGRKHGHVISGTI